MVAAAVIGSAVIGGVASAAGSRSAANAQQHAADTSAGAQLAMFNQIREDQGPFRQAGYSALGSIAGGFGLGPASGGVDSGFFSHQFNADDLNSNLAPNYDFMLKQGQGAVTNLANVTGGLSGNTFKALNDYTQNYAQNAYQQAFNNYTSNQTNIFNRLASIAGLGQTAGSNSTTGASTFGGNIGNSIQAGGNAQAAGAVGTANAISGASNNIANYYMLSSLFPGGIGSDPAIKQDVERVGTLPNGIGLYAFRYKPAWRARWGDGVHFGFMADEVERVLPEAVTYHPDGYRMVNYMKVVNHAH